MNKHTVSLARAKELDKAGWKKETLYYWIFNNWKWGLTVLRVGTGGEDNKWLKGRTYKYNHSIGGVIMGGIHKELLEENKLTPKQYDKNMTTYYPAPIASEILEEIKEVKINGRIYNIIFTYNPVIKKWCALYQGDKEEQQANTPVNALSDMYCYLKKEKLI